MKSGIKLIAKERKRQIEKEGWTPEHDDSHDDGSLLYAAACYAVSATGDDCEPTLQEVCYHTDGTLTYTMWPKSWSSKWDKRDKHDDLRKLVIAGALIAAEIDRRIRNGDV